VRRSIHRDRGMASIMDAFMFLMAMVALCAFLFCEQGQEVATDEGAQARVERSLAVLASITLEVPSSDGPQNDNPSIELISLIQPTDVENGFFLPQWAVPQVRDIIIGMLGSGWGYEWSVSCDGSESVLISDGCCSVAAEVFASNIQCSSYGDIWMLTLKTWRG
jgi:hypothetical protein